MNNNQYILQGGEDEMEFMPIIPLNEDGSEDEGLQSISDELPILPLDRKSVV